MNLFYVPGFTVHDASVTLDREESRHAFAVLRLRAGDTVLVTNGQGLMAEAEVAGGDARACFLQLTKIEEAAPDGPRLRMAVAPTKNHDRFEWFAEKAMELGLSTLTPLICQRSERKKIQRERLMRVLVAALKQSQRARLPELSQETAFSTMVTTEAAGEKFIAWCGDTARPHLKDVLKPGYDASILIGPEGDFTPEEVDLAIKSGFRPISLGKNRLRTETAALAACHVFNLINEDV